MGMTYKFYIKYNPDLYPPVQGREIKNLHIYTGSSITQYTFALPSNADKLTNMQGRLQNIDCMEVPDEV